MSIHVKKTYCKLYEWFEKKKFCYKRVTRRKDKHLPFKYSLMITKRSLNKVTEKQSCVTQSPQCNILVTFQSPLIHHNVTFQSLLSHHYDIFQSHLSHHYVTFQSLLSHHCVTIQQPLIHHYVTFLSHYSNISTPLHVYMPF